MSLQSFIPSISMTTDVVLWCSAYCKGTPAEHQVSFIMDDQPYSMNLCDECLEEFLDNGPPKG